MVLTRRQLARARRWLPLWSLLMVLMSFGSRAATDLCTLTPHCSQSERLHAGGAAGAARASSPSSRL